MRFKEIYTKDIYNFISLNKIEYYTSFFISEHILNKKFWVLTKNKYSYTNNGIAYKRYYYISA